MTESSDANRTRGADIKRRRLALGIKSQHKFAEATERFGMKVSRDAIIAAESDTASDETYDRLESFLDRFEEETGGPATPPRIGAAEPDLVTFRLSGNFGVEVTVKGPVSNIEELESAVERLIRKMGDESQK